MPTFTRLIRLLLYGLSFLGMIRLYLSEYALGGNGIPYSLPSVITVFQGHGPYSEGTWGLETLFSLVTSTTEYCWDCPAGHPQLRTPPQEQHCAETNAQGLSCFDFRSFFYYVCLLLCFSLAK